MVDLPDDIGLYITGGEPSTEVKQIIRQNGLNNIHFIGFKSHEELRNRYATADVFVLPTRYDI